MKIEIVQGDLSRVTDVDAVVRPTDTELRLSVGDAAALTHRAGAALLDAARARAPVALGAAVETPGGGLAARWVIHAAVAGFRREDLAAPRRAGTFTSEAILLAATRSALAVAERLGCASVALPQLGAAAAFPADDGAAVLLDALWAHFREHVVGSLQRVVVVLPSPRDRDRLQAALEAREQRDPLVGDPEGTAPTVSRTTRDPLPSPRAAWPDGALPSSTHAIDSGDWGDGNPDGKR